MSTHGFSTVGEVARSLRRAGYLTDNEIATAVLLALGLHRPLLVEGPAGTGKTALAKALAASSGARVVRLQCHEGVDESRALYEWDYRKQLLAIQAGPASTGVEDVYAEGYLLARPLLETLRAEDDVVLLVDEVDRLGIEAEALLLEFLAEQQVTVPELGTITAKRHHPVVLTSNNSRELSDALRRRCVFLHVDYPNPARERDIVLAGVAGVSPEIAEQIATVVAGLRSLDLRKRPSVAETLDWASSLEVTGTERIDDAAIHAALPLLLKSRADVELALKELDIA